MSNAIVNSLPIVAATLAEQSGITLSIGGTTAYTNGQHVNLPALPLEVSETTAMLAYGYLYHEGGHIRYTDFSCIAKLEKAIEREVLNTLEDGRIETRTMQDFPGAKIRLEGLSKILDTEPLPATTPTPPVLFQQYVFLQMVTGELGREWCFPLWEQSRKQFTEVFGENLRTKVEALIGNTSKLLSTASLLGTVRALVAALEQAKDEEEKKANQEQEQPEPQNAQSDPATGDDDADSDDGTPQSQQDADTQPQYDGETGNTPDQPEEKGSEDAEGAGAQQQTGDGAEQQPAGTAGDGGSPGQQDSDPAGADDAGNPQCGDKLQSKIAQAIQAVLDAQDEDFGPGRDDKIEAHLADSAGNETGKPVSMMQAIKPEAGGADYIPHPQVADSVRQLRYRLRALLEAETKTRHTVRTAGTRLAGSRLFRLETGNTDVFRHTTKRRGVNTAISLLLDQSSSTDDTVEDRRIYQVATDSAFALAEAVEGVKGVAMAVNAFPYYVEDQYVPGLLRVKGFGEGLRKARPAFGSVTPQGLTPMAEALMSAAIELYNRKEDRKILICPTDGQPDDGVQVRYVIDMIEKMGIELVGIGIKFDDVKGYFKDSLVVNSVKELPQSLIATLDRLLN